MATQTATKTKVAKKLGKLIANPVVIDQAEKYYATKMHTRTNFFLGLCEALFESNVYDYDVEYHAVAFLATEIMHEYDRERLKEFCGQSIDSWVDDISPEDVLVWATERPWFDLMIKNAYARANKFDPYEFAVLAQAGCNCEKCVSIKMHYPQDPGLFDECPCPTCTS